MIPIMRLPAATDAQNTLLSADNHTRRGAWFHFTLPITPMPDGSDELLTPLSADNRVRWSQISISRYR